MIKTVGEGIQKYKVVLRSYVAWRNKRRKYYHNGDPRGHWSDSELYELRRRSKELAAMVKVFKLTKKEKTAIDKECGVGDNNPEDVAVVPLI